MTFTNNYLAPSPINPHLTSIYNSKHACRNKFGMSILSPFCPNCSVCSDFTIVCIFSFRPVLTRPGVSRQSVKVCPRCLLPQVGRGVGCQVEMRSHTVCSPAIGLWLCPRALADEVTHSHTHIHTQAQAGAGRFQECSHSAQGKRKPDRMKLRFVLTSMQMKNMVPSWAAILPDTR